MSGSGECFGENVGQVLFEFYVGEQLYLLSAATAKDISGLVPSAAYISDPTMDW